jgi:transcriptional regulator with XRE-family HTH domain
MWTAFGMQARDARLAKDWTAAELARLAGMSSAFVYLIEAGESGSIEGAVRIARALGLRAELELVDPRRRADRRRSLAGDVVHSMMGESEAGHLRSLGYSLGLDVPYQHYQFAGRADLVAWDLEARALLPIENRTRFPDFQEMAGAFNAKRAYLGRSLAERLGIGAWASETHVIGALWSSEVLHPLRLRTESFRSICPDPPDAFEAWWAANPPERGSVATLIVLDPRARGRQRAFVGLDDALSARPRYHDYASAAQAVERGRSA